MPTFSDEGHLGFLRNTKINDHTIKMPIFNFVLYITMVNKRYRISKGQSNMENPEKLST
jgi:hypothetical protein